MSTYQPPAKRPRPTFGSALKTTPTSTPSASVSASRTQGSNDDSAPGSSVAAGSDLDTSTSTSTSSTTMRRTQKQEAGPDYDKGVKYWEGVESSMDGVLGGFGEGPVPHIDPLSSRLFILSLLPQTHSFPSPLTPTPSPPIYRTRALDVGAGIGRVTRDVLLPLFDEVVLAEPVGKFVDEAKRDSAGWWDLRQGKADTLERGSGKGRGKRVWLIKGGLQTLDPARPADGGESKGVVGVGGGGEGEGLEGERMEDGGEVVYDAIWCQWVLGHMTHTDLVAFLRRARKTLREETTDSYIFVKENVCEDMNGQPREFLDEEDSSLTRSNGKWLQVFAEAGLSVIKEEVQVGMPVELFTVKTWALR